MHGEAIGRDPSVPMGQQFTVSTALPGFDVSIQRVVTRASQEIDRYGVAEHYQAVSSIVAIGPIATVTVTAVPTVEASPTSVLTPVPINNPTRLAGLNPGARSCSPTVEFARLLWSV